MAGSLAAAAPPPLIHRLVDDYFARDTRSPDGKVYCGTLRESTNVKTCEVECARLEVDCSDLVLEKGQFEKAAPLVDRCEVIGDTFAQRPLANNGWANQPISGRHAFPKDVEVSFRVEVPSGTGRALQMIGLNDDPAANATYTSINYVIYTYKINGSYRVRVYESGQIRGDFGAWASGDKFAVRRVGTQVEYLRNDVVFYRSTVPSTGFLCADSSFYSQATGPYAVGFSNITEGKVCSI